MSDEILDLSESSSGIESDDEFKTQQLPSEDAATDLPDTAKEDVVTESVAAAAAVEPVEEGEELVGPSDISKTAIDTAVETHFDDPVSVGQVKLEESLSNAEEAEAETQGLDNEGSSEGQTGSEEESKPDMLSESAREGESMAEKSKDESTTNVVRGSVGNIEQAAP